MPSLLPLNNLGADRFESLIQTMLKSVIGPGTTTFGPGRDGAREATFAGSAPYPSSSNQWTGDWIFQVKFHDLTLVGATKARAAIISDLDAELDRLLNKYGRQFQNYILITNVPLSGVHETGTIDRIATEVVSKYKARVPNIHVWGAADVSRLLEPLAEVRRPYSDLLLTGDLIDALLGQQEKSDVELTTTMRAFLATSFTREQAAELDQAGDVSGLGKESIRLEQVFFDLAAAVAWDQPQSAVHVDRWQAYLVEQSLDAVSALVASAMLSGAFDGIVLIGGPGQGKSTVGQYLAQVHRAALLDRLSSVALDDTYIPLKPRFPFRVILRDFAQWLQEHDDETLESYLAYRVALISGRELSRNDLGHVLSKNPILVVLDGLDEVADGPARQLLMRRLGEFLDRCRTVLKADLQVLATTRPGSYNQEFSSDVFLHLELEKLVEPQVVEYARRWCLAKVPDPERADRVLEIMADCLRDGQIRLLTTTPLQVTILLVIIVAGGTPPPQREALFDQYLDVIYKREQAKGKTIMASERESLVGLHQYMGYLLAQAAAAATSVDAVLTREEYVTTVSSYLKAEDRYSPTELRAAKLRAITVDAGERLVLLVESPADRFGFELRSIQEFFAACHLTDTASDSTNRYARFEAIAVLPAWRNVTLFLAGRVGRNYPGEAATIVEVCRDLDRVGPDRFIQRGSLLAVDLALDRVFGPKRGLQRSLIEEGLRVLEPVRASSDRLALGQRLLRLPEEDRRDHLWPVLTDRLATRNPRALVGLLQAFAADVPIPEAWPVVSSLAEAGDHDGRVEAAITAAVIPHDAHAAGLVFASLLSSDGSDILGEAVQHLPNWAAVMNLALMAYDLDGQESVVSGVLREALLRGQFLTSPDVS